MTRLQISRWKTFNNYPINRWIRRQHRFSTGKFLWTIQVYFPFLRAKLNPKLTRHPLMHQDIVQGHKLGFTDLILSPNFLYFTDHAGLLWNKNEKGLYKLAENKSLSICCYGSWSVVQQLCCWGTFLLLKSRRLVINEMDDTEQLKKRAEHYEYQRAASTTLPAPHTVP